MTRKKIYVRDLSVGDMVSDLFAVATAQRREAKNGPYWQLTLMDRTGQMEARIWSPASQSTPELSRGMIVHVEGTVTAYNGQNQINVTACTPHPPEGIDITPFLATSAIPAEELFAHLQSLLDTGLSYAPWHKLCAVALNDAEIRAALLRAPGAKNVHHAYVGGLLEHTLAVMRLTQSIAEHYPEADRQILLVAALFHDLGKAWEISVGIDRDYTAEGQLVGHLVLSMLILERCLAQVPDLPAPLALHLKHLVVSHHGQPEFGAPRQPATIEAFILHFADNIDAKIATVRAALQNAHAGTWSDRLPALGRAVLAPWRTP